MGRSQNAANHHFIVSAVRRRELKSSFSRRVQSDALPSRSALFEAACPGDVVGGNHVAEREAHVRL